MTRPTEKESTMDPTYSESAPSWPYESGETGDRGDRLAEMAQDCDICGAVVTLTELHTAWHRRLGV